VIKPAAGKIPLLKAAAMAGTLPPIILSCTPRWSALAAARKAEHPG